MFSRVYQRTLGALALAALTTAGVVQANIYTWTAGAANDYWDSNSNWSPFSLPGTYPNSTSDDAVIYSTNNGDDIQLINEDIDDLTISDDVSFTPKSGTVSLSVDSITISGSSSGVTATMSGTASIYTR